MTGIISDDGLPVLNTALGSVIGGTSQGSVHLFKVPSSLSPPDFVPSTFTDLTSPGYAPLPLAYAFNPGPISPFLSNTIYFTPCTFVSTAPNGETVLGYYILSHDGLTVLWAELFPTPIVWTIPFDPIVVVPTFTANIPTVGETMPIATVDGVPLTVAAATDLYIVPAGMTFVATGVCLRPSLQTGPNGGSQYGVARLSDAAYLFSQIVDGGQVVGGNQQALAGAINSPNLNVASGDTVQFVVSSIDIGVANVVSVDLFGYLV